MCKKSNLLLRALLAGALLLTAACSDSSLPDAAKPQLYDIPKEHGKINGLSLFEGSYSKLRRVFGRPLKDNAGMDEAIGQPFRSLTFRNARAYLVSGQLYTLVCFGPICKSQAGVKIGDSYQRVIKLHNKGKLEQRSDGTFFLRYQVKDAGYQLIYKIRDGRVFQMDMWFYYA